MLNWVIDDYIFESRSVIGDFPQALRDAGHNVYLTKYKPLADSYEQDYGHQTFSFEPTTIYGTIGYVKRCNKPYFKYGFGNETDCNVYYPNLPELWMLNNKFIMVPFGYFKRNWPHYFRLMDEKKLFIRPNSGKKSFTGMVISEDNTEFELSSSMQITSVTDETICLISPAKEIEGEFRFVIGNCEVIDGSEYRWDNILDIRHDWPKDCWELADKMAKHVWQPDLIYCVDVAATSVGPKIIELNSFSCAGLYACDKNIIANRISDIILKDYYGELD